MKKRVILFFTFLALALFTLAFAVSADSIYDDFTQFGKGGEEPIFNYLGYSTAENEDSIAVGYTANIDALAKYEERIGAPLKYGLVITLKELLGGKLPLDENGNPIEGNDKIYVMTFEEKFTRISASFREIPADKFDTHLIMTLFVVDPETGVSYIGEESTQEGPESISLNDAKNENGATPAVPHPTEVTIGNITYAIDAVTEQAFDRVKQQNASNADYNVGSSSDLSSIEGKANIIAIGGFLINLPMASSLMSHYLDNTGTNYNLDVAKFM